MPKQRRQISLSAAVGLVIVAAMTFFVLGTRWDSLQSLWQNDGSVGNSLPADLDYSEVEQVYDLLRVKYDGDLSYDALINGLKEGLARATDDPYTVYLSEEESKAFLDGLNGTFTGIGAELGIENDRLIIVAPLKGFPAEVAGLQPQDVITAINGEDTFGIKVEEAVSKIRGPEGSDVTLTIARGGQTFDVTITRQEITVPSVTSEIRDDGIGVLTISRFAEDTYDLSLAAAEEFKQNRVKGVVVDLRNNSGGYLNGAVDIASLWLDGQVVVEQRRGDRVENALKSRSGAPLAGMPTVVLINAGSASASEIVAGALKDYEVATLVGTTSFGKGSVQELQEVKSGGTLKVTTARWYTPNGNTIDQTGIAPDIEVELSAEDIAAERDPQLEAAVEQL